MKFSTLLLLLNILISCHPKKEFETSKITIDTDNIGTLTYSQIFDFNTFIHFKTKNLISDIQTIDEAGEHLIVHCRRPTDFLLIKNTSDSSEVVFDRQGDGPQEYKSLNSFAVANDEKSIYILDNKSGKISQISLAGEFIDSWKSKYLLSAQSILHLGENTFSVHGGSFFYGESNHQVLIIDVLKDELITQSIKIPKNQRELLFIESSNFIRDTHLYHNILNDTIYNISRNEITPSFILDFGSANLPEKYLHAEYDGLMDYVDKLNSIDNAHSTSNFLTNHSLLYFTFQQNGRLVHALHDRELDKHYLYDHINKDIFGFLELGIAADYTDIFKGTFKNQFVFVVEPAEQISIMDKLKADMNDIEWKQFVKNNDAWIRLITSNETNNPFLALVKYKESE